MTDDAMFGAAARLHGAHVSEPNAVALIFGENEFSYRRLHEKVDALCAWLLAQGMLPEDRVVYMGSTSVDGIVAMLAVQKAHGIFVPVNPRYGREELDHILSDSDPREVWFDTLPVFWSEADASVTASRNRRVRILSDLLREAESGTTMALTRDPTSWPADEDIALLIYTSGTTGRSKGVALSYGAICTNIFALTSAWGFSRSDRLVLQLPLFHVHGLCIGLYGTLLHGMTALLSPKFQPETVVAAFETAGATVFMGVPTMYSHLLRHLEENPAAIEALQRGRLFTSGSAPLPYEDFQRFERLTACSILERYGMSETLLTLSNPYDGERRPGTVGLPVAGCFCRVVNDEGADVADDEIGELWVKSNGLMTGYWGQPEHTEEAFSQGWFRTGDVAKCSPDGYFTLVGRKSTDIVKSGGYKISTREIEDVLSRHAEVAELAVVGVPDDLWGESVAAVLVPADNSKEKPAATWLEEFRCLCDGVLADYKRPRQVFVVASLPRNALGKIQKKIIQQQLQDTAGKEKGPS